MVTILDLINQIGDKLQSDWMPQAWEESAEIIRRFRERIKGSITDGMLSEDVADFQRDEMLTPREQSDLAGAVAADLEFRENIPLMIVEMRALLAKSWHDEMQTLYIRACVAIAVAYNKTTPDGISFESKVTATDLAVLPMLRVDGLTYTEHLEQTTDGAALRIRGIVNDAITRHGSTTNAQREVLDEVDGMLNQITKTIKMKFENFAIATEKRAEKDNESVVQG